MKQFEIVEGSKASGTHLEQAVKLDQLVYSSDHQGFYGNCLEWFRKNPSIYTFLMDKEDGRVVAYVNAMPIVQNLYNRIGLGSVKDIHISATDILEYKPNTAYVLYFCSLVVHPDYQATKAFSMLYNAYIEKLIRLCNDGIYIEKVIGEGLSQKGARMCRLSGLTPILNKIDGTVIYELPTVRKDFKPLSSTAERLKELYTQSTK